MNNCWIRFKIQYSSGIIDWGFSKLIELEKPAPTIPAPFFIMGSGRNGSTLLSCILNNHPEICIPVEHSIIPTSIKYWYAHPFQNWEQRVNSIQKRLLETNYWNLNVDEIRSKVDSLESDDRQIQAILDIIYRQVAKQNGKSKCIWGDKTPSNTQFIKLTKAQFPNSKILFLVRDPRDYIASMLSMKPESKNYLNFLIWRWMDALSKYDSLCTSHPNDVKLLKYESLVTNTETEVNGILDWLGLSPCSDMLTGYSRHLNFLHADTAEHHKRIREPISSASIERWRTVLIESQINLIENRTAKKMEELGYLR